MDCCGCNNVQDKILKKKTHRTIGEKAAGQPGPLIIASWRRPDPERIWLRVCISEKTMGANSWMNKNSMWFVDELDKKQSPKENIL
jgi:hypothetical protein